MSHPVWHIGRMRLNGPVALGPMSGFTSNGYRRFMKPFGVSLSYTEMVSDNGIIHGHRKTVTYVDFDGQHPTGLQLFGNDPEDLRRAAAMSLERNPNIDFIDVNMGCPVHKVVRNGAGSALMRDPKKCGRIIDALKSDLDIPVTAKIRLGWDSGHINFREVIEELQSSGADAIALHARTTEERYSGDPHYDLVGDLQDDMSVPLIMSGNIFSLDDAIGALGATHAKGIMVARGGIGNPFLVTQIDTFARTGERLENPTVHQQMGWCLRLADILVGEMGEEVAARRLRSIAPKFVAGCRRCREYRKRLATQLTDMDALRRITEEIDSRMGSSRI